MIKHKSFKLTPTQMLLGGIGIGIVFTALVLAVNQMASGSFNLISNASDPCSAYTRKKPLGSASGVVASKGEASFVWNMNGDASLPKVVLICAGTEVTRQFGGNITFADIKVGDRVDLAGWYGGTVGLQASNTTILPQWIRDVSTSLAGEWTSTVSFVDVPRSSFVLDAVDLTVGGVKGKYKLNVKYTPTTQCFTQSTYRKTKKSMTCSSVTIGQTVAVSGVLDDQTLTLTAGTILVR